MAKSFGVGPDWIPATVTKVLGPVTYQVQSDNGQSQKRHIEQLKKFTEEVQSESTTATTTTTSDVSDLPWVPSTEVDTRSEEHVEQNDVELNGTEPLGSENENSPNGNVDRYPTRVRQPPSRYM